MFGTGTAADTCRKSADTLVGNPDDTWTRFGRYWYGDKPITIRTKSVDPTEVSHKARTIMERLQNHGGEGHYELVEYGNIRTESVRILSPPRENLYGKAFGEIFKELDSHGIPVFIDAHADFVDGGHIVVENLVSQGSKTAFFLKPRGGNYVNRHELNHVHDYATKVASFRRSLPDLPERVVRLLEKKEAGEVLEDHEEVVFRAVANLPIFLGESRASEANLRRLLFSKRGIWEIVDRQTWRQEILMYMTEPLNASLANARLLRSLQTIDPQHPDRYAVGLKMVVFAASSFNAFLVLALGPLYSFFTLMNIIY